MAKKKSALLIIDGQNDFVLPTGALPVAGAVQDMDRVAKFIMDNLDDLDNITCTLDSHRTIAIFHPCWWKDKNGKNAPPFTMITEQDVKDGVWTPQFSVAWSHDYVRKLAQQGEFPLFIWPYHCLIGTTGHALYEPLAKALGAWEQKHGRIVIYVTKGDNALTEHYGAFRANIEVPSDPYTQFNQNLIADLMKYDDVYLAGEARSHCVINSLKQALDNVPQLANKVVIMEDCMSDVPGLPSGFYDHVKGLYEDARNKGARFTKVADINLKQGVQQAAAVV